jgi:hypothetical protein
MRICDYLRRFHRSILGRRRSAPSRTRRARLELEALEDRVVPTILFGKPGAESVVTPRGSQVLPMVSVELIFWGSDWTDTTRNGRISNLDFLHNIWTAASDIMASHYADKLGQYGIQGVVPTVDEIIVSDRSPGATFNDDQVRGLLQALMRAGTLPEPSADVAGVNGGNSLSQRLYFVIPQPGSIARTSDLGLHSTATFHDDADDPPKFDHTEGDIDDAPVDYPYAWTVNDGNLDTITSTFSHELVEAVTDPAGNGIQLKRKPTTKPGWNEIGDNAAQLYTYRIGTHLVQSYWSQEEANGVGRFVGPDGNSQTFDVNLAGQLTVTGDQRPQSTDDSLTLGTTILTDVYTHRSETDIQARLNGETATFGPSFLPSDADPGFKFGPTYIKSIEVNPGAGTNTVDVTATLVPVTIKGNGSDSVSLGNGIDGVQDIKADVTVKNASPHSTDLYVNDAFDPKGRAASVSDHAIKGMAEKATFHYDPAGLKSLQISGSRLPGNRFTFTDTPSGADTGQDVPTSLVLYGNHDIVNVQATADRGPLFIVETFGHADINVSKDHKVEDIKGALSVVSVPLPFGRGVALTVDDSADAKHREVTLSGTEITGLAPAIISYAAARLGSLKVLGSSAGSTYLVSETPSSPVSGFRVLLQGGHGKDKFTVAATTGPLTIDGGGGADTVTLGNPESGKVDGLGGAVNVINTGGKTQLIVDDHGDTTGRAVAVTDKDITGLPSAAITYNPGSISSLTVDGGSGADSFTVTPSKQVSFIINGNGPATAPGDSLKLTDNTGATVKITGPGAGTITFKGPKVTGVKDILFTGIEDLLVPH